MRDDDTPCCEPKFWANLTVSLALVAFAGLTSGLSIGLLSYTQVDLEVLVKAGLPRDKKNAAKILPVVKNECFLLCTLLIGKSLAMETLPIFLDTILPFWVAILVSVTFVMAFAEVIPQVVCSRYGLSFGAKFMPFVRFLLFVFFPVAYPISKLLDWLLGKGHAALLRRTELETLVHLHSIKAGRGGDLTDDETTIITGALNMGEKTAKDAMTPISKTFSLDVNSKLDMHTMGAIVSRGHSRVPVYAGNPTNITGLILVKNLIFCHPEDETPIKDLMIRPIPSVHEDWALYDILKMFQKGDSHMAVVVKPKKEPATTDDKEARMVALSTEEVGPLEATGIITMEDIMEQLLQEEILDETDRHAEIHKIRVNIMTPRRLSSSSVSSPHSQFYTPVLRSPIPPFVPSPLIKPVLHASPGKPTSRSVSPHNPQVSRKSYEKLRRSTNV